MRLSLPSISKLAASAAVLACLCTSGTVVHARINSSHSSMRRRRPSTAYAGVSGKARLASLYRTQWTGLPQAFTGFHLAYDRPTLDKSMGFGFLLSNEQAGAGALNRIQFMGQASHNLRLGRRLNLRTGMQLGFGARSIDMTNLVFMDQILRDFADVSIEQGLGAGTQYMDMGAGFMLLSRRVWFGASANHLTSPNVSLNPALPEQLAVLYGHGGARIQLARGPRQQFRRRGCVLEIHAARRLQPIGCQCLLRHEPVHAGRVVQGLPTGAADRSRTSTHCLVFGFGSLISRWGTATTSP